MFRTVSFIGLLCLITLPAARLAVAEDTPAYKIDTVIEGLDSPWGLAFLPNGRMLITELGGTLRLVINNELVDEPVAGIPEVYYAGQGGLMDIIADRDFANNQRIYLTYSYGKRRANATRLLSARLVNGELVDQQILFTASPLKSTPHHYGGRMVQLSDGSLVLTVGDGFNYREQAQTLDNHFGKIVRINIDGTAHADNPFRDTAGALPEIWSYGHRNQQAIVVAGDGTIYEHEHGPRGGDEVNLIEPGKNYGWPAITYGVDYSGAQITPYTEYEGMEQPLVNWTPSIAPAGMTYYDGSLFPQWQGGLFVVSLKERSVRRVTLKDGKLVRDDRVFPELKSRMRDIRTGPDGALYILTDGDNGKLLRISPE